jgi:hypothetical protein
LDYSLLLTTNTFAIYAPRHGAKFVSGAPDGGTMVASCLIGPGAIAPQTDRGQGKNEQPFHMTLGMGIHNTSGGQDRPQSPFTLKMDIAPACFLKLPQKAQSCRVEGNTCVISTTNMTARFDAGTGRLIEFRAEEDGSTYTVTPATNTLRQAISELQAQTATMTNWYSSARPFGSAIGFLAGEIMQEAFFEARVTNAGLNKIPGPLAVNALNRLASAVAQGPFDQMFPTNPVANDHNFFIPASVGPSQNNPVVAYIATLAFNGCDRLFPKYSWPWTVSRESVMMANGNHQHTEAELNRLILSDNVGPASCLALASGLAQIHSPEARQVASRGLTQMNGAKFIKADCGLLLSGNSGAAKLFASLATELRSLPEDEVSALAQALDPAEGQLLKECAAALRANPNKPVLETLAPPLTKYWEQRLKAQVRAGLMKMLNEQ